jgi:hypothetical protein
MKNKSLMKLLTAAAPALFLLIPATASAQESGGVAPLFDGHAVIDVRIQAPLKTLARKRPDEEYLDARFSYSETDGSERTFDLKLRTRGRYRRQRSTCPFPPVRLNFPKKAVEGTLLDGQDKLKLVTHCNTRRDNYEQLVLREYLTYRILQTLTEKSFGARLLRINWVDTEGDDPFVRYGFVIEDDDDIGPRTGLQKLKSNGLSYKEVDAAHTNLISVFQFLIGNTDYSLVRGPAGSDCCHNSVPFKAVGPVFPIPYDFDFSGLVDAPYAEPNPQFRIRSVTKRVYRGRCFNNERLPDTLAYFKDRKAEIYGLVDEVAALDDKNRKAVIDYLDSFYEIAEDPGKAEKELIRECS